LRLSLTTALMLSIIVHCIFMVSTMQLNVIKPINTKENKIEIQILEQKSTLTKKSQSSSQKKRRSKVRQTKIKKTIPLNKLVFSNHTTQFANNDNALTTNKKNITGGYDDGSYNKFSKSKGAFGVMNSMGAAEYAENIWFYELLWNKINSNITYPIDLANQRIAGAVNVHASLNLEGK